MRITIPHSNLAKVLSSFSDCEWYICYPHFGKEGNNEHFHVFFPAVTKPDTERYRKRVKTLGISGNQSISVKLQTNSVLEAIKYGSHEGTHPVVSGSSVRSWLDSAPKWISDTEYRSVKKRKRSDDGPVKLTCVNHVTLAFEYRKVHNIRTDDLCEVVRKMLDSGDYVVDANFMRSGAPDFLIDVFKDSVDAGRVTWKAMSCRGGLWKPPRQTW